MIVGLGVVCALGFSVPLVAENIGEKDGLKFTMTLQKTTYETTEQINITFAVTNVSNQTITLLRSEPEFDFIVYNSSNSKLYQWSLFKVFPMVVWYEPLDPGENFTRVLVWPQTCNQSIANNEGIPVSPGRYFIVGLYLRYLLQAGPLQIDIGAEQSIPVIIVVGAIVALTVIVIVAGFLTRKR